MSKELEMRILSSQAQAVAEQLDRIESGIAEIEYIKNSIIELKNVKENTEILSPVSSGIFIKAKLEKMNKLLINAGNGIVVEKTAEEANEMLSERIKEMESMKDRLMEQMRKIEEKLEKGD